MSTRTIIEINHDMLRTITQGQAEQLIAFVRGLQHSLGTVEKLSPPPNGIRILAQRHHSTKLKLTVE